MARLEFEGLHELHLSFEKIAAIPVDVKARMATEAGKVVAEAHRQKLEQYGAIETGQLAASIKPGRPKTEGEISIEVRPSGSRTRGKKSTSNEAIGYIIEYGKRGMPARPWMREANAECEEKAVEAAAKPYEDWLEKTGL